MQDHEEKEAIGKKRCIWKGAKYKFTREKMSKQRNTSIDRPKRRLNELEREFTDWKKKIDEYFTLHWNREIGRWKNVRAFDRQRGKNKTPQPNSNRVSRSEP